MIPTRFRGRLNRVLIVRLSAIGDTILTTPLLAAIKDQMPEVEVDWVVEPKSRAIVEMCQGVSRIFTFPRFPGFSSLLHPARMAEFMRQRAIVMPEMRDRHYDVALAVQDRLKSGLALLASNARSKVGWRLGDAEEANWAFTTDWIAMPRTGHVVDRWLTMAHAIGCKPAPARFPISPPEEAMERMGDYLNEVRRSGPVIIMNAGSSKADRRWSAVRLAEASKMANQDFGAVSIFTWGNEVERAVVEEAVTESDGSAIECKETTLYTLAALVAQADAFVGGDTGPMHLAAALGTPVVGIFGASDPERTGPYGSNNVCVNRFPQIQAEGMLAMDSITADDVYAKLAEILGRTRTKTIAAEADSLMAPGLCQG
ncbi:MAG: glycosyltransferase family 9 protein [Armatimonadota bacterium]